MLSLLEARFSRVHEAESEVGRTFFLKKVCRDLRRSVVVVVVMVVVVGVVVGLMGGVVGVVGVLGCMVGVVGWLGWWPPANEGS